VCGVFQIFVWLQEKEVREWKKKKYRLKVNGKKEKNNRK